MKKDFTMQYKNIFWPLFGVMCVSIITLTLFKRQIYAEEISKKNSPTFQVGLLIMATGKYIEFVPPLIESAKKYFCTDHHVTYFVFTDGDLPTQPHVVTIPQERMGWPYDSMMRFHTYFAHQDTFKNCDYLFAIDADMLFASAITGEEIFGTRVGTRHPQFLFERGLYETNPISTACVHRGEGKQYFCGGFYGGATQEFLKLCKVTKDNIDTDLARGFVAVFNDESHINRYFIDNPPTRVLSPSYCHFENWKSPYPKKVLALDKECAKTRIASTFNPLEYYRKFLGKELQKQTHVT